MTAKALRISRALRARDGRWLLTLPRGKSVGRSYPELVMTTGEGAVLSATYAARFLDAGDYDCDGKGEVILLVRRYNMDGYALVQHDGKTVRFDWIYH